MWCNCPGPDSYRGGGHLLVLLAAYLACSMRVVKMIVQKGDLSFFSFLTMTRGEVIAAEYHAVFPTQNLSRASLYAHYPN